MKRSKSAPSKTASPKTVQVVEADDGSIEILPADEGDDLDAPSPDEISAIEIEPLDEDLGTTQKAESSTRSVVPYSTLDAYLREIKRFPHLTREEEKELALRYLTHNDLGAARTLIQSNLWLVVKTARDYQDAARNLLDLIQEGNMGLMEAVKNFDPHREVRFPSYALWWIKAYIVRYLIANFRLVKIGTTQAQRKLFFNLKKEKDRLERDGFFPAPKLLAEKLNVRESDIIEMEQRLGSPDVSVDAPLGEDSDGDLLSIMPNDSMNAEDLLGRREIREKLQENLAEFEKSLNEKERAIFQERLLTDEKATLQELSDRFSVSKERIRQIEVRVMEKLKAFLLEHMGQTLEGRDFDI